MALGEPDYKKTFIICLLIITGIGIPESYGQKKLKDNIGQPSTHVITLGPDRITVDNSTGFKARDTVLLIQMQGMGIQDVDNAVYGSPQNAFGEPGLHEFIIVKQVVGNEIVFEKNIRNAYDAAGNIQIVRVPYYNTATVTSKLYCDPWDSASAHGGVLALIIGRRLKLDADIDLTGTGFRGGKDTVGKGDCAYVVPQTLSYYYSRSFMNAGYKGEGLSIHNEFGDLLGWTKTKGQGPNFTGGGGGNGKYSGGGGGSNKGVGGIGGREHTTCGSPLTGGVGGKIPGGTYVERLYMGGGGGASTSATGTSGSGGHGGGIIIIVTDTIISAGGKIVANGAGGGAAISNGGAGGGGGGGSIALSLNSFGDQPLTLSAGGGKGGDNGLSRGTGGGGGGGFLFTSIPVTINVTPVVNGGDKGACPSGNTAVNGAAGEILPGFIAVLNGFLYNSIRSSKSGDQVDSICSDRVPWKITGTTPVGGTAPYTYLWEKSYDSIAWIPLTNDADPKHYTPSAMEAATHWYKRTVTDASGTPLVDISMPVKMIVQPKIQNNIVGFSDTICFSKDPPAFTPQAVLNGGNNKAYAYLWEVSTDNIVFSTPGNAHSAAGYTPPPSLEVTSFYRRTVTSGRCVDGTAVVKITVLDTISKNRILNAPPDICFGMPFTDLQGSTTSTGTTLSGGDGTYRFKWQSSLNGAAWSDASGIINLPDHNPVELPQRSPMNEYKFRRIVYSGNHDACITTSNVVILKDYPLITNNTITAAQEVCSGSAPLALAGSAPANGNGTYTYTWQDSTGVHTWQDIPGSVNVALPDYLPPVLTTTTSYRRIVNSSACSDISKSVRMIVHSPITNNIISLLSGGVDTTLCNGQTPHRLKGTVALGGRDIPGTYDYQWLSSTDNITFNPISGETGLGYQPPSLTIPTYYKRRVVSGACTVISAATIRITALPLITNNIISSPQTICYNTQPVSLTGGAPGGGDGSYTYLWEQSTNGGTTWAAASGTINLAGYTPPQLTNPVKYRRTVVSGLSGCCVNVSLPIDISIHPPLPTAAITNIADTTICGGSDVLLKLKLTGSAPWKITWKENSADGPVSTSSSPNTTLTINPLAPGDLNVYNYSISKIEDVNGCLATALSGIKKANVYKVPVANAEPDKTVCGPVVTLNAAPTSGTGTWTFPGGVTAATANSSLMTFKIDSVSAGPYNTSGHVSFKFYWQEINWTCKSKDSVTVSFDRRIGPVFAGDDTPIYSFDNVFHLANDPVLGWETGTWTKMGGTGEISDSNSDGVQDIISGLSSGINSFLWTVTNGTCHAEDQLNIEVLPIFVPEGFSPNNDGINDIFVISGLDLANQSAELRVVNSAGTEVFSTSNIGEEWTDWNGTSSKGSELPEGTYYYLLKLTSKSEHATTGTFKKSGFVILRINR